MVNAPATEPDENWKGNTKNELIALLCEQEGYKTWRKVNGMYTSNLTRKQIEAGIKKFELERQYSDIVKKHKPPLTKRLTRPPSPPLPPPSTPPPFKAVTDTHADLMAACELIVEAHGKWTAAQAALREYNNSKGKVT
jgi:hypothetical protein